MSCISQSCCLLFVIIEWNLTQFGFDIFKINFVACHSIRNVSCAHIMHMN
jgi:hypothetical protein